MHAVNVSTLKNNPAQALQWAQSQPVVVLNRAKPMAMVLGMDSLPSDKTANARMALAVSLFKDGGLSWMQAAAYAECSASHFMKHLARLGIPIIDMTEEEVLKDIDTLTKWLAE